MNARVQRAILYYPTIKIRNTSWLKQALLYWDVVGTIVPHELERRADASRDFRELREHGAIRFYHPEQYVGGDEQLSEEFIHLRNSTKYQALFRQYENSSQRFEVYGDKIPGDLKRYLHQHHLAEEHDFGSLTLNKLDGLLFMSLLAKYIADEDRSAATTPGTDYRAYRDLAFATGVQNDGIPVFSFTLEQLLPTPSESVTLADVLEFKEDHQTELLGFREVIDNFQSQIKAVATNGELQHVVAHFSEIIQRNVQILGQLLADSRLGATYGMLEGILGSNTPELVGDIADVVTNPTPINIAGKIYRSIVRVKKTRIEAANEQRRTLATNSFTYLYCARQQGIIDAL
jgi:hypothetical protein